MRTPEANATVERRRAGKSEGAATATKGVSAPHEPEVGPCEVYFSRSATLNLGNYESMKIEVSLKMPALATPSGVERAFTVARTWVDAKLEAEIGGAKEGLGLE